MAYWQSKLRRRTFDPLMVAVAMVLSGCVAAVDSTSEDIAEEEGSAEEHAGAVEGGDGEAVESTQQPLCEQGVCYTSWGLTAASACSAAHSDCYSGGGGVDFCQKSSQDCGAVYCSCTYCDPCQSPGMEMQMQ